MDKTNQLYQELKNLLFQREDVLAAWEGGSHATGFADEFSDLDLSIVCKENSVEEIFSSLNTFLEKEYGILQKYRVPEPTWHGFSQCFYKIDQVKHLFYLDIALIRESIPDKFTQKDRHGEAILWFEKEPFLDSTSSSWESILSRGKKLYLTSCQSDFILETEVYKNLSRKRFGEAFPFYFQFLVRHLGIMLNLKYRPAKSDFGIRYAYRDYEKEDADLLVSLMQATTLEELSHNFELARTRYYQLKTELAPNWKE